MKVVFHPDFHDVYSADPAAESGRLKPAERALGARHEIVVPRPIDAATARIVHGREHVEEVRSEGRIWRMALLAAGGALEAARLAAGGEPAFALVRPPGHHASPSSAWGFCHLNNVAIAVASLLSAGTVRSALVLDIDLHLGDGTRNVFSGRESVLYLHPEGPDRAGWMDACRSAIEGAGPRDIVAVSAGFDRHVEDWGGMLLTSDYEVVGSLVRAYALEHCEGRLFAVLEGGYNPSSLAEAAVALAGSMG